MSVLGCRWRCEYTVYQDEIIGTVGVVSVSMNLIGSAHVAGVDIGTVGVGTVCKSHCRKCFDGGVGGGIVGSVFIGSSPLIRTC